MELDAILLDAGGVLLDETEHEAAIARIVSDALGIDERAYDDAVAEAVRCYVPRVYGHVIWRHTAPDVPAYERIHEAFRARYQASRPALRLMPGIGDELRALHGHLRIGIAGQYGAALLDTLEAADLLDLFAWRFTQDDFALTKPDPRYLLQIAEACGVAPGACLMVGDRIDKDVVPARQVGMRTIRIRTGLHRDQIPRLPEEVPDVELPAVEGLAAAALGLAERAARV